MRRGLRFIVPIREDLKVLTICRWNYKGSTFSSVNLRPWVLVWPVFLWTTVRRTLHDLFFLIIVCTLHLKRNWDWVKVRGETFSLLGQSLSFLRLALSDRPKISPIGRELEYYTMSMAYLENLEFSGEVLILFFVVTTMPRSFSIDDVNCDDNATN